MKKYELMFILKAGTTEEEVKQQVEKVEKFLKAKKCENVVVEVLGVKKFAYTIDYKTEGTYVLVNFESQPEVPNELSAQFRINESVVRHLFVVKE